MSIFNNYYVRFTVREDVCNKNSAISQLVLDRQINGATVFSISDLKELADKGNLWVEAHDGHPRAMVRIFYSSYYGQWIATTYADSRQCNNLLTLPIYYGYSNQGGVTYFQSCSLR